MSTGQNLFLRCETMRALNLVFSSWKHRQPLCYPTLKAYCGYRNSVKMTFGLDAEMSNS